MTGVEVTQADRDAVFAYWNHPAEHRIVPITAVSDDHALIQAFARHRQAAEQDGHRYKRALMDIGAALLAGRVCDDTAWFSTTETLFDFIQSVLEPEGTESVDMFGNFPISRDERRIINFLRNDRNMKTAMMDYAADAIERGDHRKEG